MKKAIYPGTFDPITNGHIDVLKRSCRMFDQVIVVVANNVSKTPLFSVDERLDLIQSCIESIPQAKVTSMQSELTVDVAKSLGAIAIIRGLRAISDFEYEFQMAQMNRILDGDIETVFFMPNEDYFFTSSNLVKQVSSIAQERISTLVPPPVLEALRKKHKTKDS